MHLQEEGLKVLMTQCAYCGKENPEHAVHCRECGSELCPKPDENLNGPDGLFARNPMGKRYWNLAAGSLVISIASIMALVVWDLWDVQSNGS